MIKTKEGKVFEGSLNQTILDSAIKAKLNFEYSCKTGQCGVCKTNLIKGDVIELQEQLALSDIDKLSKTILTCCCAPQTEILIDAEDLSELNGIVTNTFPARVNYIKQYTTEIIEVELRLPPSACFNFIEGQYIDVIQSSTRRSYSIASSTNKNKITLLIKRFKNGEMSDYWFNHAKVNDLLRIEGPKGTFFLRDKSVSILFLATGTGIAPIISILSKLDEDEGYKQENTIIVCWGNRNREDFVWIPEFKRIKVKFYKVCSRPTLDWSGEVGYVQDVALKKQSQISNYDIYACGSSAMIQSARKLFNEECLLGNHFYSDAFVQSY